MGNAGSEIADPVPGSTIHHKHGLSEVAVFEVVTGNLIETIVQSQNLTNGAGFTSETDVKSWDWAKNSSGEATSNEYVIATISANSDTIYLQGARIAILVLNGFGDSLKLDVPIDKIGTDDTPPSSSGGIQVLLGGDGADWLQGNDADKIYALGGKGVDYIWGSIERDPADPQSGDDVIFGAAGNDLIFGLSGDDVIDGGLNDDRILGGGSTDQGFDELRGSEGNDTILGGEKQDKIFGDQHDDLILGTTGNDTISGGEGEDTLSYTETDMGALVGVAGGLASGVELTLTPGDGTEWFQTTHVTGEFNGETWTDNASGIERLILSEFADTFRVGEGGFADTRLISIDAGEGNYEMDTSGNPVFFVP